jgi:large conductance mechanosensitive channel
VGTVARSLWRPDEEERPMLKGFKEFIMKGNVVDLAVGIVIGAAFTGVVNQLTASFLKPLIQLVGGGGIDGGSVVIDGVTFDYAAFINAVITFLITAAAIYFLVVAPFNALRERRSRGQEPEVEPTHEERVELLLQQLVDAQRNR